MLSLMGMMAMQKKISKKKNHFLMGEVSDWIGCGGRVILIDGIRTYHHGTFTFLLIEIPLVYSYSKKSCSKTKHTESSKGDLFCISKDQPPIHSIRSTQKPSCNKTITTTTKKVR